MGSRRRAGALGVAALAALAALAASAPAAAGPGTDALAHEDVEGAPIERLEVGGKAVAFAELDRARAPSRVVVGFRARGEAVRIPHCNGRGRVLVDGAVRDRGSKGPLVVRLGASGEHEVRVEVDVSAYEKRVACGEPPRAGAVVRSTSGLATLRFASPHAKGGEAVVFVPRGHDASKPSALLVGLHPWNGTPWTYAAYRELLDQAQANDVVLLMPSGLGNSLYTAPAEDEVMRAIEAARGAVAVDGARVSLWGASMGGAGATTIGFHHPDRFALVVSYFGDSAYDLSTYVKRILGGEAGAHAVNALDVVDNARHLPVWLVHGEADRTSPIRQSEVLARAMKARGFAVDFDHAAGMGHEGPLVARYLRRVVDRAAAARAPSRPSRVSFRSVRGADGGAYGVRIVRAGEGDAFVDVERQGDGVRVLAASGVLEIVLADGALGARPGAPVTFAPGVAPVAVRWGG